MSIDCTRELAGLVVAEAELARPGSVCPPPTDRKRICKRQTAEQGPYPVSVQGRSQVPFEGPTDDAGSAEYAHGGLPEILTPLADEQREEFAEKKNPQNIVKAEEMKFAEALRRSRGQDETVIAQFADRLFNAMQAKARRITCKRRLV